MANSNPQLKNLELGRGKRPKLNNITVGMRISPDTKARLEEIAEDFGCTYGGKAWIAGLLEKIGSNELIVSKAPSYLLRDSQSDDKVVPPAASPSKTGSKPQAYEEESITIFEDEIADCYGKISEIVSETKIGKKECKHEPEHHSLSSNSD